MGSFLGIMEGAGGGEERSLGRGHMPWRDEGQPMLVRDNGEEADPDPGSRPGRILQTP